MMLCSEDFFELPKILKFSLKGEKTSSTSRLWRKKNREQQMRLGEVYIDLRTALACQHSV